MARRRNRKPVRTVPAGRNTTARRAAQRRNEAAQTERNRKAFLETYNKANPTRPYGSPGFKADVKKANDRAARIRAAQKPRKITLDRPPTGSYDVDIDAQERAAKRGYGNTIEDLGRARERAATDFGLETGNVQREYGENLSDLLKSRTQSQQDYGTNLQTIARNFSQLGNVQAQRGRQAGLGGGFAAQARRKRTANEAIERAPVDLGFQRFMEGSKLAETQLGQARDRGIGQLGLGYDRGAEDYGTTQTRAGTELQAYIQDAAAARQAQWKQALPTVTLGKKAKPKPKPKPVRTVPVGRGTIAARARARARRRRI